MRHRAQGGRLWPLVLAILLTAITVPEARRAPTIGNGRISIVFGDLLDYERIEATIAENDIAFVFHLAAQAIVKRANLAPRSTVQSNVLGTMNILEAARTCHSIIRGVVVASSDKAYGDHGGKPYKEIDSLLGGRKSKSAHAGVPAPCIPVGGFPIHQRTTLSDTVAW